jgi:hypothetical protein
MSIFVQAVGVGLVPLLVSQTAGQAREIKAPTARIELERRIPLTCYIDGNHRYMSGTLTVTQSEGVHESTS